MNNSVLIGNLTRDPELRFVAGSGKAVCNFTIAVNRDGSKDKSDFIPIVVWGKPAENCANYLSKGKKVAVKGSIATSTYKNKDGDTIYKTEVLAFRTEFLSPSGAKVVNESQVDDFQAIEDDEDIPF